jgi:ABC-2 type transport system ATP-binding protein
MYTIKNLSKYFYDESWWSFLKNRKKIALNNINLDFNQGDSIGVIGKNGSGKSTLLKIIGNILLADKASTSFDINKAHTSYISGNERAFFWRLTVKENLEFFSKMYGLKKEFAEAQIMKIADDFNFTEFLDIKFASLSSGFKKKISIARALLKNPDIFLFDEITNSLDFSSKNKIKDLFTLLKKNQSKKILFWASHDTSEILDLCNKVIILEKGEITRIILKGDDDFNERIFNEYL